jgi:hypothetical protein
MGFTIFEVAPGVAGWRFECCGQAKGERVIVHRPNAALYRTEFVKCQVCGVMFHWPWTFTGDKTGGHVSPPLPGYVPPPPKEPTADDLAIKEAAARANRSKGRGWTS